MNSYKRIKIEFELKVKLYDYFKGEAVEIVFATRKSNPIFVNPNIWNRFLWQDKLKNLVKKLANDIFSTITKNMPSTPAFKN